jgi:SAM-dependent methyltransferase
MLPLSKQNAYRERYKKLRPGWQPSGEAFEALTRQHIGPTVRVLDLGCGRGGVMELFWREVKLAAGLDPDHASLVEHRVRSAPGGAGARSDNVRLRPALWAEASPRQPGGDPSRKERAQGDKHMPLICGLGEALPFRTGSFDLVIAMWVLEHLAQPETVFREIRRVLVPGGHLLFLTPNAQHPLILFNRFSWAFPAVQRLLIPRLYGRAEADTFRVRYRANTLARLRALAAAHGFRVASLHAIKDPTYLAFNELFFQMGVLMEDVWPEGWGVHVVGDLAKTS